MPRKQVQQPEMGLDYGRWSRAAPGGGRGDAGAGRCRAGRSSRGRGRHRPLVAQPLVDDDEHAVSDGDGLLLAAPPGDAVVLGVPIGALRPGDAPGPALAAYSIQPGALAVQVQECEDRTMDGVNGQHRCSGAMSRCPVLRPPPARRRRHGPRPRPAPGARTACASLPNSGAAPCPLGSTDSTRTPPAQFNFAVSGGVRTWAGSPRGGGRARRCQPPGAGRTGRGRC
jgi:hypothetical protein